MAGRRNNTLTSELADYIQHVTYDDIPARVVQRAKEAVIDGIGVMLAGHSTDCGILIRRYIGGLGVSGNCTAVGDASALPAEYAALANGVNGHAHDYDDTQISSVPDRVYGLLTHPTTPVLSAALPVAEEAGASGQELITAFCAGVEVACKVAEAINPYHYKNGFHSTGTIGIFGAAAAAAKLYRLDTEATHHALGIAASKSAGIRAAFGTMTKPYHAGAAAEGGIVAAKLAGTGYKTDPNALDGPWGYFQVAGGGVDADLIHGKLGNPYTFEDPGVSIKSYPCGSLAHPSMDALLDLILEHDIRPELVSSIRLGTTSNVLAALRYREPTNEMEAKFSIPFCLAILVLEHRGGINQFTDEVVRRPNMREMMSRVSPYLHEDLEAMGFQRIRSLVEVTLKDGTELSREASTSRGTPERPMMQQELADKFHDCAQGTLPAEAQEQALELIYHLEELKDVKRLTGLLHG
jgi:2-methylcitrate dehydratase PrpD